MTLLDNINVAGTDYRVKTNLILGSCSTPAGTEVKVCSFNDIFTLTAGNVFAITFQYANTYGDGSTLYPKISVNGVSYPLKLLVGAYAASGAWADGQTVIMYFDGTNFVKII